MLWRQSRLLNLPTFLDFADRVRRCCFCPVAIMSLESEVHCYRSESRPICLDPRMECELMIYIEAFLPFD